MSVFTSFIGNTKITAVSSQLDKCIEGAAVFYNLASGDVAKEKFVQRLENSKAKIVFVNRELSIEDKRVTVLAPEEFKALLKKSVDELYPINNKVKFVAITGTNGKTSTVYLLSQLLRQKNKCVLSIGTLGVFLDGKQVADEGLTTPGLPELRAIIAKYQARVDFVLLEASSHALSQNRLYGISLASAGWTNLTQDHLDYHKTMDEYFESKLLILKMLQDNAKLFVSDEVLFEKICSKTKSAIKVNEAKVSNVDVGLKTEFAQKNLCLALSIFSQLGFEQADLSLLIAPPGRFETIIIAGKHVIVDYAHTPDALVNACRGVRISYPDKKLVTIFGCGGDRDKLKRPLMLEAAITNSDRVVVTSDNPRSEQPEQIIADILAGTSYKNIETQVDRKIAIESTVRSMASDEIVLIAGKGHETYQEIRGVKHPFDDVKIVRDILGT